MSNDEKLKDLIMEIFDMRPSTAEKCIAILDNIKSIIENEDIRKKGHWIIVTRHEHYPSGKPYEKLQCPFCKKFDHNGDGNFCGYCGAEMQKGENDE